MSGRRQLAMLAAAVVLSGAAWAAVASGDDAGYRRAPEHRQVVRPGPDRTAAPAPVPPCTPPPGMRDGGYICAFLGTAPPGG